MAMSPATGSAATTIHTSAEGLNEGMFELPVADGTMAAYCARPAQGSGFPVVLVVQEIFGLHDHIRDVCRRFAHEGYMAVSAELYQRQGDAAAYTDIPKLVQDIVSRVPDEQVMSDLDACVSWAGANGGDVSRVGVTGFCWGGRITWLYAAHNPRCRAGVAWYGRLVQGHGALQVRHPVDVAGELHAPVLGLYGELDAGIPLDGVERMRQALARGNTASHASEIIVYPGADHAFYADYRPSYHPQAAADAWQRTVAWFARHLKA